MSPSTVLASLLIVTGLAGLTISTIGVIRLPDVYLRLHAASKSALFGVVLVLAGSIGTGDLAIILRAALVAIFVVVTAPVSAHAIGRAAYRNRKDAEEENGER